MLFKVFFLFTLGIIMGSFLNACIYRLPRGLTLLKPKHSFCPLCNKQLRWYDLFPLLSFLLLRGTCRFCKKQISLRYPLVELSVGLLFTSLVLTPFSAASLLLIAEMYLLIGIFFSDLETSIIPDEFTFTGIILGISYGLLMNAWHESLLACAFAGAFFLLITKIGKIIYKKEAMGGGDTKLVMMLGSFLLIKKTVLMLYLSFFIGSAIALVLLITKIKKRTDPMPFGPAIVLAGFISLIWGEQLIKLWLL